jgi:hypothetical protein
MLGSEISQFIKAHDDIRAFFLGVFAIDSIPKSIKKDHICIVNTSKATEPGTHWICVASFDNQLQVFDSLGTSSDYIKQTLHFKKFKTFKYNDTPLQSKESVLCGQFCCYYVFCRLLNKDLSFVDLLNSIFTSDVERNEQIIKRFYEHMEFYEPD